MNSTGWWTYAFGLPDDPIQVDPVTLLLAIILSNESFDLRHDPSSGWGSGGYTDSKGDIWPDPQLEFPKSTAQWLWGWSHNHLGTTPDEGLNVVLNWLGAALGSYQKIAKEVFDPSTYPYNTLDNPADRLAVALPERKWDPGMYSAATEVLSPSKSDWRTEQFGATWGNKKNHAPTNFEAALIYKWDTFDIYTIR